MVVFSEEATLFDDGAGAGASVSVSFGYVESTTHKEKDL